MARFYGGRKGRSTRGVHKCHVVNVGSNEAAWLITGIFVLLFSFFRFIFYFFG